MDGRLIVLLIWGGGTVLAYGVVLSKRRFAFRLHHDRRSKRELLAGSALFLTALCSALAIVFVLFGQPGTGIRGLVTAIALGAFTGAGIVMASEDPTEDS